MSFINIVNCADWPKNEDPAMIWRYQLNDSEFVHNGIVEGDQFKNSRRVWVAVIDTYESRSLNVAANLIRALRWWEEIGNLPIDDIIKWNKEHNPRYAKYADDVDKYLVLV